MKQKLAALGLLLCGVAFFQRNLPPPDPSGLMAIQKANQQGDTSKTGLIADPTGAVHFLIKQKQANP